MSRLFQPLSLGALELANRIVIAPMCQYSAENGNATDWHMIHLGTLAQSGAGLLIVEATAVTPEGRISPADLGLYDDANEAALERVVEAARRYGTTPLAIQLGHAGRKASCRKPWDGGTQIAPDAPDGWQTVAPSALPFADGNVAPVALDDAGLTRLRDAFAEAARRAARLGFVGIELHAAHGYLLHQFLSPLSNRRTDRYGGSLENRLRFPLEVFDAIREVFPADRPVWARVSATDWVDGGWDVDGTIAFARALKERGAAAIHVSSGGLSPAQQIPVGPGYQVPLAEAVRKAVDLPVIAVGLITDPEEAEAILTEGQADAIGIARAALYDPRWPWHAAAKLGAQIDAPPQYWRSEPREYRNLFRTKP
ncbi:NADH:flavin oxidoreductase [Neoasaia chiangmaiensis NBRC 101099]|uniref:Oxidoreductase n=1 Tax=Neoasaia chiangmaiensis TaxID=320497 RepID=A0A1U9KQ22_9PROT|nr:NADH:flavin oxidoreductase/NADH oxidase [Neoasaia chiangmaiensis]AQS87886.1 oxidoreductase [Neoasaia chiangmaiensis]GBR39178.1 NADH:flavin oxidoreductase [Neoasaia chiangmaiensis NBRC 101099]GEN15533.1 oxidoreductase [Neoasaia chiangmaiensis]